MEWFYTASCAAALIVCLVLGWLTRPKPDNSVGAPDGFRQFQFKYLLAWAVCVLADWLQGPYVYALYEAYGFSREDNAKLFVVGFGSSFLFGTFVAGLADTYGRKRMVLAYCALYIASCMTKHVNHFGVLMVGRVTGGIATSILFSVFESWLVYEHSVRNEFPAKLLSYNFSLMWFVNYLVAVVSGLSSQSFVDMLALKPVFGPVHFGGYLMPFDLAILAMVIGGAYVMANWEENYGERASGVLEAVTNFAQCGVMIATNFKMALCCAIVSLFESSMYIFVFNWTPVLEQGATPPHGIVFSTFMMCAMIGASTYALCSGFQNKNMLLAALATAATGMLLPAYVGISAGKTAQNLWAFLLFEFAVGIYFPAISTLKSDIVPEANRSTVYNLFRAPMNMIVVAVLLINPNLVATFQLLCQMLVAAVVLMAVLNAVTASSDKANPWKSAMAEPKTVSESKPLLA